MRIDVLTLFPEAFRGFLDHSILQIALEKKLLEIRLSNIRNFTYDKHRQVDDRPYGGNPGMLMKAEPVFRALEAVYVEPETSPRILLFCPQGSVFAQKKAEELSRSRHLILICGHYEGFDERIRTGIDLEEISIGDYVLSGGEIPAMVVIDSVARLIPGVLGGENSLKTESFGSGLLEYPQYTRPPEWRGMRIPEVLASGHHKKIQEWQQEMAYKRTKERRPELLEEKNF